MKGLITKDILLLKNNRMFLFLVFFLIIGLVVFPPNYSFVVGYGGFVAVMLTLNTMDYDEQSNGLGAVLTLPVSKKTYVVEKYVLGALLGTGVWIISFILALMAEYFSTNQIDILKMFSETFIYLPVILLLIELQLPLQIKFGSERSRFVLIGVSMVLLLAALFFTKQLGAIFSDILKKLSLTSMSQMLYVITGFLFVITIIGYFISNKLSVSYMKKKKI